MKSDPHTLMALLKEPIGDRRGRMESHVDRYLVGGELHGLNHCVKVEWRTQCEYQFDCGVWNVIMGDICKVILE